MKGILQLLIIGSMVMAAGCTPTKINQSAQMTKTDHQIASPGDKTVYLRLVDYLRQVPGLSIQGNGDNVVVKIRGAASFNVDSEPLYVVNNQPIGQSYAAASSMVDPNDIKYVRVLKDVVSTAQYGMRGSNGVIVIKMKDGSN